MPDVHAKLSASGSGRWMACPGSVILEDLFEDEGSVYAEEGTTANAVAEARLRAEFDPTDAEKRERVNAPQRNDHARNVAIHGAIRGVLQKHR